MAEDYGYWSALTGPMQTAGDLQKNREADTLRAIQMMQNIRQQQLAQLDKNQNLQQQLNLASQAAMSDLYTKNKFARQKDIDDFKNWHEASSGWGDIQNLLREYGSVDNARLYGNLDYALEQYKHKLSTNPISLRVNQNKKSLEGYHALALDKDGGAKFLTSGVNARYQQFINGDIDNFIFNGQRSDYLADPDGVKYGGIEDNITIDSVISNNYSAIVKDMVEDINPDNVQEFVNNLAYDDIKAFVARELNWSESTAGVQYFGDQAHYGTKPIDTEFSTELVRALDAVNSAEVFTIQDFLDLKEEGLTFRDVFNKADKGKIRLEFERLGGMSDAQTEDFGRLKYMIGVKDRQIVASDAIFANDNIKTAITESWAGEYTGDQAGISRYSSKNGMVYGVKTEGLYDDFGHKITQKDIGGIGAGMWDEVEKMDLKLENYHVALKAVGKNAQGERTSFLLSDTTDYEKDLAKIQKEWSDVQLTQTIVAELRDQDWPTYDETYYKEIDLSDANVQMALNERFPANDLNNVKTQNIEYKKELEHKNYQNKRVDALKSKIVKQLDLPNAASVDQVINAYDQTLSIGLKLANVPNKKVDAVVPLIISDLYVNSRQPREYPFKIDSETTANNPTEYMAHMAKKFKFGLQNNQIPGLLEAINKGPSAYDEWRKRNLDDKSYKQTSILSRNLAKYYHNI